MGDFADDIKSQDNEPSFVPKITATCSSCTNIIDLNVNSYGLCDDCIRKLQSNQ